MAPFRLLAHTADMGLEATAATLEQLWVEAARGLLAVYGGSPAATPQEALEVVVSGHDLAELLVGWLNEIVFLLENRRFFPANFAIDELDGQQLRATIRGEPLDPARHRFSRDVKAVTYHQLRLEQRGDHWYTRLYLDL